MVAESLSPASASSQHPGLQASTMPHSQPCLRRFADANHISAPAAGLHDCTVTSASIHGLRRFDSIRFSRAIWSRHLRQACSFRVVGIYVCCCTGPPALAGRAGPATALVAPKLAMTGDTCALQAVLLCSVPPELRRGPHHTTPVERASTWVRTAQPDDELQTRDRAAAWQIAGMCRSTAYNCHSPTAAQRSRQ